MRLTDSGRTGDFTSTKPPYGTLMRATAVPNTNKGAVSSHEKRPRWNRDRALEEPKSMEQSDLDDYQDSGRRALENGEILRELYVEKDLSCRHISEQVECSTAEVYEALKKHGIQKHPENLFLEARVRKGYIEKLKSARELSEEYGISQTEVYDILERGDVETRGNGGAQRIKNLSKPAGFYTCETRGHEYSFGLSRKGSEYQKEEVAIHRLVAVAEYGFDAVVGKQIHHINGVHWDNRPSNLEPLTREEHVRRHFHDRPLATGMREASKAEIYHALEQTGNLDVLEVADE